MQKQKMPRSKPVRQPPLDSLQYLLQTQGHDVLQVQGRFEGKWVAGRVRGHTACVSCAHGLCRLWAPLTVLS